MLHRLSPRAPRLRAAASATLLAAVAAGLAACASSPAAMPAPRPAPSTAPAPQSDNPPLLYVTNQDDATISIVDPATRRVLRTVDLQRLGFGANAKPHHVAVEPDGSYWYVTLIGENRILKLDRGDHVVAQASFETPGMLALDPTSDLLVVGRSMTAVNPPKRIGILHRGDMAIEEVDVPFPRPHAMLVNPATGIAYTASLADNQMAAVRLRDQQVAAQPVAGPPHAMMQYALSPDGRTLVASGELSHQLLFFDLSDPMRPVLQASVNVGAQPFDPVYTPDGRWIYLGNKAMNSVTVVNAATRQVARVITHEALAQPHGTAVSPDGRYVFVSNNNTKGGHAVHDMGAAGAGAGASAASTGAAHHARRPPARRPPARRPPARRPPARRPPARPAVTPGASSSSTRRRSRWWQSSWWATTRPGSPSRPLDERLDRAPASTRLAASRGCHLLARTHHDRRRELCRRPVACRSCAGGRRRQ